MSKEIVRPLNDGDTDYDGEEDNEDIESVYLRDWEASTLLW